MVLEEACKYMEIKDITSVAKRALKMRKNKNNNVLGWVNYERSKH